MDTNNNDHTIFGWRITTPQVASIFLAGVYLAGFLVLNAHLGKRGIFDFGLANSRYLIAGTHFVVFLIVWYLSAGRAIIFFNKWTCEEIKSATELGLSHFWRFVIFTNSLMRLGFLTCISAAYFSLILLESPEPITLYIYLAILFLIDYSWVSSNFNLHYPRANQIFKLVTRIVAIIVFFITINISSMTMIVFLHFITISIYVNLVTDSFERFRITSDRLTHNIISSAIFVLLSSASFGRLYYEHITPDFGGGQLQEVEIIVVDQTVRNSLEVMGFKVEPFLKAKLIYENQQEFIIDVEDQTIRLSRKTVAGFKVLPVEDSQIDTMKSYLLDFD